MQISLVALVDGLLGLKLRRNLWNQQNKKAQRQLRNPQKVLTLVLL